MPGRAARNGHPELADIFRTHYPRLDSLSEQQRRVAAAIMSCRTAALGGHVRECDHGCGYEEISYNSCRDRHCPKCQGLERVRWQEARAEDLLPVPYFHVVFTIPHLLHPIFFVDPRLAYTLLFTAAAKTLQEVAAESKNLGAEIGMTGVLHTWTQTLLFHPHIHFIVPGGGLDSTRERWIQARKTFFLPVRILSEVFRAKLLKAIENAVERGDLPRNLPFAGPEQVLAYLGRYTHRIAIANERILSLDGDQVTFAYRDRRDHDRSKRTTLDGPAFLRRFLLHVLPPGFVRIRHYGVLANSVRRDRIALCRRLLDVPSQSPPVSPPPTETWDEILLRTTGTDVLCCPHCSQGRLVVTRVIPGGRSPVLPDARASPPSRSLSSPGAAP